MEERRILFKKSLASLASTHKATGWVRGYCNYAKLSSKEGELAH